VGLATRWKPELRERLSSLIESPGFPYQAALKGTFQLCDGDPASACGLYDSFIDTWAQGRPRIEYMPGLQVLAALAAFSISRPAGPGGPPHSANDPGRLEVLRHYVKERPQGHLFQVAVDLLLAHQRSFQVPQDQPMVEPIHPLEPHQVIDGHLRFLVDRARMSMHHAARPYELAPIEPPPLPRE
jgi:hypothetical protein